MGKASMELIKGRITKDEKKFIDIHYYDDT